MDRLTPQAQNLEISVLGTILSYGKEFYRVSPLFSTDLFYGEQNQMLARAIMELSKVGMPIDLVTVLDRLGKAKTLDAAGGMARVVEVNGKYADQSNLEYHVRILMQFAIKRELIRLSSELNAFAFDPSEDVLQTLSRFEKGVVAITERITKGDAYNSLAEKEEVESCLVKWRENTFERGLTTGIRSLDKYLLFKRGNFNVFNGFDNVGKSSMLWYLCLLSSLLYGWKWIILSSENRNGSVVKKLIEFYWSESITKMSEMRYQKAKEFVEKHFTLMNNEKMYNYKEVLRVASVLNDESEWHGLLIDPYNALQIAISDSSKLSTHEYHYEAATEMQQFAKKKNMCVYMNCHVVTKALRDRTAPHKGDTEGGSKFANKADDFITLHREIQDPDRWTETQIHTRKIKELETGGGYTPADQPFILKMTPGGCGFEDLDGNNAVLNFHNIPKVIQPEFERLSEPERPVLNISYKEEWE